MLIDTHAHIMTIDQSVYPHHTEGQPPATAFFPSRATTAEMMLGGMPSAGVDKVVLVQTTMIHGYDNSYICDTAQKNPSKVAAVCVLDPAAKDNAKKADYWLRERGGAGLRLSTVGTTAAIVEDAEIWKLSEELNTPLKIHFQRGKAAEEGMPKLLAMIRRFPKVRVILDHCGNVAFKATAPHGLEPVLALEPHNVVVMVSTGTFHRIESDGVGPASVVRTLVEKFGAKRLMWGSDFPNTPGTYRDLVGYMRKIVGGLSAADQEWITSKTALSVFPQLAG
jgi:predicted TIM-barrel fold metal-dependent hydrolase